MAEVVLITGTSKGIGRHLVDHYQAKGMTVLGCSRSPLADPPQDYEHFCLDVADEMAVKKMFHAVYKKHGRLDILVNNAGIASMNHSMLMPLSTVQSVFNTNVYGTFLCCREAAKIMSRNKYGRIVNFATVATPLDLEGESAYAASKAAVESFTRIMAKEFAPFNVTVNAVGPTPVATDLIKGVAQEKIDELLQSQAIKRLGVLSDISNAVDFFIRKESEFITGQVLYLGGVS